MARKLRLEFPGACYHVINRGNYRRDLFAPRGAAEAFERVLFEACARFGWRLHAFVIMRNHFHLAVETPKPNLSDGMKWLQGTWAARFNRYRGESGRPFQGRYKALHVEPGEALAAVGHYIHLNPVRAKVVPADRLGEYRWSSFWHFPQKRRPAFLVAETLLQECGGLADTGAGWRCYRDYLALMAEEDPRQRQERQQRLSRNWCVGSPEYRQALKRDLAALGANLEHAELLGGWNEAWRQERQAQWEQGLRQLAAALPIDLAALPAQRSALPKVQLAALLRAKTGVSNRWLAERLQMGPPASVSQYVRRFRLAGGETGPAFRRALSIVNT
jgi:REP element-mobilizing transposase RayT